MYNEDHDLTYHCHYLEEAFMNW